MIPQPTLHLLSGGIDSTVLLYDLIAQGCCLHCLMVDYGQENVGKELHFAEKHCRRLDIPYTKIGLPQLMGSTLTDGKGGIVVPNRNAILLSIATNLAVASHSQIVTFAANSGDQSNFPDCRKTFIDSFNYMLCIQSIDVEVCAPYLDKSKAWICARSQEIGVNLIDTWSCYRAGPTPCGVCDACKKKAEALL